MSDELSAPMLDREVIVAEPIIADSGPEAQNSAEFSDHHSEEIPQTTSNSEAEADCKCGVNDIHSVDADDSVPLELPKFLHLLALAEGNLASVTNIYDDTEAICDPAADAEVKAEIASDSERETESDSSPQTVADNLVESASGFDIEIAAIVQEAPVIVKVVHVSTAVQTDPEFECIELQKPSTSNFFEVPAAAVPCAVDNDAIAEESIEVTDTLTTDTNTSEDKKDEEHDTNAGAVIIEETLIELQADVVEVDDKEVVVEDVVGVDEEQVEIEVIVELDDKQVEVDNIVEVEVKEDVTEVEVNIVEVEEVVIIEVTRKDAVSEDEAAIVECADAAILDDAAVSITPPTVISDPSDIAAPEEHICRVTELIASDEPTSLESIMPLPGSDPPVSTLETTCPLSGLSPCMCASKPPPSIEDDVLESVVVADVDYCGVEQAEVVPDSEVPLADNEVVLTVVDEGLLQNLDEVILTEEEVAVSTVSEEVVAIDEYKEIANVVEDVVLINQEEGVIVNADEVVTMDVNANVYADDADADELAETDVDEVIITDMEEIFAVRQSTYFEKAAQTVEAEVQPCEETLTAREYTVEEEEEALLPSTPPTLVHVCDTEEVTLIPSTPPALVNACDEEEEKALLPSASPTHVNACGIEEVTLVPSTPPTQVNVCDDDTACSKDIVDRVTEEMLEGDLAISTCEIQEALTRDEMMVGYSDDMYLDENALKVDTFSKRLDYLLSVDKLNSPKKVPEEGILVDGEAVNEIVVIKESIVVTENIIIQENVYIKESIVIKECITMETTKATYRPASLIKPERVLPAVLEVSDTIALDGVIEKEEDILPSCDATESVASLEAVADEGLGLEVEVQGGLEIEGVEDVDMPDVKSSLEGLSLEDAQDPDKGVKSKVSLFTRLFGKKEPPAAEKVLICCSGVLSAGTCYSTFADDSLGVVACDKTTLATTVSDMITSEDTDEGFTEA